MRFVFCKTDAKLETAVEKLKHYFADSYPALQQPQLGHGD